MMSQTMRHKSLSLDEKRDLLALLLRKEIERTPSILSSRDGLRDESVGDVNAGAALANERVARHRQQFPALANKSYFNYGAHGTLPRPAIEAALRSYEYAQQWGPFSTEVNEWAQQEISRTKAYLAAQLGASADTIALTENVTVGCNIALWGLDWQAGDHILLTDCENPGIVAAVQAIARRFHLEVSTCPVMESLKQGTPLDAVAQGLRARTRLVVLSHVLWNTGQVLPLADIADLCRSHAQETGGRIRMLVDGAQSFGALPLKMEESGADFYAFTGHKWLCGPEGVGGLYVRPEALEELQPTFVGWRSVSIDKTDGALSWQRGAQRFEVATSAYPLFAGLRSAIDIHDSFDSTENRYARILRLSRYLWEKLKAASEALPTAAIECLQTSPPETGIVIIRLSGHAHQQVAHFLEAEGCYARAMYDPECLRFCAHYLTTQTEIDRLVYLLQHYVSQRSERPAGSS
jgi:L-cysteine/cystine lyase